MIAKIVGSFWIIFGALWLTKPEILRNRLKRKMTRKARRIVFGFVIVFGLMLAGSVLKAPGILAKMIGIIGLIITIRAIMLLTSKTSEKVLEWWANKPLMFFRIWGAVVLLLGLAAFII
ncbi:MAG: hypothetical protein KKG95_04495 [Candidatus Omnitrophica bacterium]|nr:hypothetical protein [Candidatus Omnitrophota bacterium]MBU1128328.1 hypothetical protein [Candidatus Omnitrophota bacterium]MBU1657307.1 hypothetical protein [Candidatus Omnitrophota bacterium]MBU1784578.1 hypothetical protein [Candidatus Omnitrophota bacterium]